MYVLQHNSVAVQCGTLGQQSAQIFDAEERHASIIALEEYIRSLRTLLVSEIGLLVHKEEALTLERRERIDSLLDKLTDAERILHEEEKGV